MSADPRVEAVLAAATAVGDRRERGAYLDQACAGDANLRREVESLLAAHDQAGTFLENPAPGAPLGVPPSGGTAPEPTEGRTSSPLAEKAKTLPPESSRLAETKIRLGDALVAIAVLDSTLTAEARLALLTEAESFLLQGHESLQQNKTADPKSKRDALKRLVRLYEALNKPEQLAEWSQKLAAFEKVEFDK